MAETTNLKSLHCLIFLLRAEWVQCQHQLTISDIELHNHLFTVCKVQKLTKNNNLQSIQPTFSKAFIIYLLHKFAKCVLDKTFGGPFGRFFLRGPKYTLIWLPNPLKQALDAWWCLLMLYNAWFWDVVLNKWNK